MKNKLAFLVIAFMAHCVTSGHSAEPSVDSKQAKLPNQPPEMSFQTLPAKIDQVRAVLTEIQILLKQEEKILAETQKQKEKIKKTDASLSDYNRASDGTKHDIQQLREQVQKAEKELATYARQNERLGSLQVEFEKAQKECLDSESAARQAEAKLAAAQNNLNELKNKLTELTKQANEAKKQSQNLENAKALLETERTKRVEALSRAEKAVATAEKTEKERLLLASRLAELEQNISSQEKQQQQQKESSEQANIQGEIEKEKKAIQETEGKIKKDEKAREEAENRILELKKQVQARGKTARGGKKEDDLNSFKARLTDVRKQRLAAESRLGEAEGKLRNSERSVEALTNTLAAAENQTQQDSESTGSSARARIQGEIENEQKALDEIRNAIAQKEKACGETEKNIAVLKQKLRESEKNARRGAGKDGDLSRLQSRLADVKKQRAEAEERLKESEGNLRESEKAIAGLTNMVAVARKQEENNSEAAKALAPLTGELEQETALMNEVTARVDKQIRSLKARDDEKRRLNESLVLVKEKLDKEGQVTNKLDEIRLQIAGQKKIRTDMEAKLEQTTRDQFALEKEIKELNQALIDAGNIILNKDNNSKATGRFADELRDEKEIARKSADLLAEKEKNVKRSGEEKEALQIKLNEVKAKLARQKEQGSTEQARIENEIEKEKKAAAETKEKIRKNDTALGEAENAIAELKKQLKGLEETERLSSQKESDTKRLQTQIAGQKKIRTDMEAKLEQTTRDQFALEKETKELNQALINAGNIISNNESNFKATEQFADELRDKKGIARKSAGLLVDKEKNVKRLGEEKNDLQNKVNQAEAKLAQQKERIKELDAKRRALEEEKQNRIASDKKYTELAHAEKEHKAQIKELESKSRAADKESKRLSSQADKASSETEAGQQAATGGSETKETQNVQTAAESSGKDTMAVEQAVLNQARTDDSHPEQQPEKKASKQSKSRSKQNKIAEAEEYYALAIQKWDEDDLEGAIEEFKKTISLNPDAAGAYYNLSLAFLRQDKKEEACDYAYKAGECYVRINNLTQAARMTVLMTKIDKNSRLIQKLRNKIDAAAR